MFGLLAAVVFARLGFWQLERAAFKSALLQRHEQAAALAPQDLPAAAVAQASEGRRVGVQGRWRADRTVWLDNRTHGGRAGVIVITPLQLADGGWLFVERGWAPLTASRTQLPSPALPSVPVRLQGRLSPPVDSGFTLGDGSEEASLWSRLDSAHMHRHAAGAKVYPMLLQLEGGDDDGLVRDWSVAASGAEKHRGYAAQWFAFSLIALGLTAWFGWKAGKHAQ